MCSMSVLCPLCAQTSFSSIDALRCSLIKAANGPLACPICHELFLGLDKLTIHLFSHTNIMNSANNIETTASSASATQKNNENYNDKAKTKEIKNPSNINNKNDSMITKQNITNEVNFENTHHTSEINIQKKAKVIKAEKKKINKLNSTQQQVAAAAGGGDGGGVVAIKEQPEVSKDIENLATCDICEFTFRNEELRDMHVRLVHQNFIYPHHHTNNIQENLNNSSSTSATTTNCRLSNENSPLEHDFKCHLCSKTFKMKGSLRVHLKVVHLMGLPYVNNAQKLSICDRIRHKENKILKSASISNVSSTSNPLQVESLNTSALNNNSNNNQIPFNIQPVNFISSLNNASHNLSVVNILHPEEYPQNSIENSTHQLNSNVLLVFNHPSSSDISLNLNPHSASTNFTDKELPPSHLTTSNGFLSTTTATSLTENPKIWECDVCSKAFTTKYFLKKHKRLHTGEMPYTCELCARTFTFQQSYHKHLLYHSDEKPHVCSTCGRAFKELSTLHNHERIHSGEKPFKCEVCGKSFRQRVSFLVHTRIHTGVMPYKCEICEKSFRYKVSQRTHKCQPISPEQSPSHDTIDHISENFIKAFLENSTNNQSHLNQSQNSPASNEIAAITEKSSSSLLNEQQALLNKTIDDIVVESCNKMGIGGSSNGFSGAAAESVVQNINEGSMSPSQKLQNMRLYSPQLVTPDLNGIDGDLTRFLLESSQAGNNLL